MIKFFPKILAVLALMLGFVTLNASADGDIQIHDPWIQTAPPSAKVLAAYLEIKNNGNQRQVLTGVSSSAFGKIEMHRSVIHGNMAHMEHLKELSIPPNASVAMQPGGLHLMLMNAKKPPNAGDQVPMTLIFGSGKTIAVTAIVRSGKTEGTEDHRHMDHSGHGEHKH